MLENVIPTLPRPMTVYDFHRLVAPEKKPLQETDQFWVNFDPVDINYQLKKYDVLVGIGEQLPEKSLDEFEKAQKVSWTTFQSE